jgi:hypothetical protein
MPNVDISKPSIANLIYALRHPQTWPAGFKWNYGGCTTCAMGLVHRLWDSQTPLPDYFSSWVELVCETLEVPPGDEDKFSEIFFDLLPQKTFMQWLLRKQPTMADVTPGYVADMLELYLVEKAIAS